MFGWSLSEPEFSKTEYDQVFCLFLACNMNGLTEERTLLKTYPIKEQNKEKWNCIILRCHFYRYLIYLYIHIFVDIYLYIYISPFIGKMCVFPSSTTGMCIYIYTYHHHYSVTSRELTYPLKKGTSEHNFPFTQVGYGSVPRKVSPIYIG